MIQDLENTDESLDSGTQAIKALITVVGCMIWTPEQH